MTPDLYEWVKEMAARISHGYTLEIGSADINGGVRELFPTSYLGIDLHEGPGVNRVLNSHELSQSFAPESFDTVLWLETLEHDSAFWETMANINAVLKKRGHLLVSAPAFDFPRHDFPGDYWRVSAEGLRLLLGGYRLLDQRTINIKNTYLKTEVACAQKLFSWRT